MQKPDHPNSRIKDIVITSENRHAKRKGKPAAVDFIPSEFDNLLEDQGTYVRITPSLICPNQTEVAGTNHALDCPLCFGAGTVDLADQAVDSWVSITGIHLDKKFEVAGVYDLKDCKMSFQTHVRVYYFYKIEILDFASTFQQMIQKSAGDTDRLRYDPTPNADTPYLLIDTEGKRYNLNEHFKAERDARMIRWISPTRPATGKLFTISYPILPTFRVIELVNENRYYYVGFKQTAKAPIQLPQQALVRWDYLARNSGSFTEQT